MLYTYIYTYPIFFYLKIGSKHHPHGELGWIYTFYSCLLYIPWRWKWGEDISNSLRCWLCIWDVRMYVWDSSKHTKYHIMFTTNIVSKQEKLFFMRMVVVFEKKMYESIWGELGWRGYKIVASYYMDSWWLQIIFSYVIVALSLCIICGSSPSLLILLLSP